MNLVEKICFYTLFGTIMSFVFTFSFIECVNLGVCDKCCHTDFQNYPLFHSRYQLVLLFSGVFTLGLVLGLLFGLMDLGNDDKVRDKLRFNLVYSLPFGGVLGSALGRILFSITINNFQFTLHNTFLNKKNFFNLLLLLLFFSNLSLEFSNIRILQSSHSSKSTKFKHRISTDCKFHSYGDLN